MDLRDKIQNDAFIAWENNSKNGTIVLATGLGKTFVALHALHSMPKNDGKRHLHLAETIEREKTFLESVKTYDEIYGCDTLAEYNIEFACYQSAYRWRSRRFGLVIADEIHDSLTPSYSDFYEYNIYEAIIGLSAKIDEDTEYEVTRGFVVLPVTKKQYLEKYCKIVYKYTMIQARKDELNRNLDVHVINHQLDSKNKVIECNGKNGKFYKTELDYYEYWYRKSKSINQNLSKEKQKLFKQISNTRINNLLYSLPSKITPCRKLLKHLDRTLIFGNSIDALEKITPYTISSRNDVGKRKGKNQYFLDLFDKHKINNIASFKKIKQGANIKDLENLILFSYYSTEKDIIQRFGRLRNSDEKGNVFVFVTERTKEEIWYLKILNHLQNVYKIINHQNIDDCLNYIKYKDESKRK